MTDEEAAEFRALQERVERLEVLLQHQAGISIALYNGLNQLGLLMLQFHRTGMELTLAAVQRREQPRETVERLQVETDAFSANLKDIHERLGLMNEHIS